MKNVFPKGGQGLTQLITVAISSSWTYIPHNCTIEAFRVGSGGFVVPLRRYIVCTPIYVLHASLYARVMMQLRTAHINIWTWLLARCTHDSCTFDTWHGADLIRSVSGSKFRQWHHLYDFQNIHLSNGGPLNSQRRVQWSVFNTLRNLGTTHVTRECDSGRNRLK